MGSRAQAAELLRIVLTPHSRPETGRGSPHGVLLSEPNEPLAAAIRFAFRVKCSPALPETILVLFKPRKFWQPLPRVSPGNLDEEETTLRRRLLPERTPSGQSEYDETAIGQLQHEEQGGADLG